MVSKVTLVLMVSKVILVFLELQGKLVQRVLLVRRVLVVNRE
jgi:hypothetical protein